MNELIDEYKALQDKIRSVVARDMSADELYHELLFFKEQVARFIEKWENVTGE